MSMTILSVEINKTIPQFLNNWFRDWDTSRQFDIDKDWMESLNMNQSNPWPLSMTQSYSMPFPPTMPTAYRTQQVLILQDTRGKLEFQNGKPEYNILTP